MTNFSAFIPVDKVAEANAALNAQGFGPNNFSVPVKTAAATAADRAGLHCWNAPPFRAAVAALGYATIEDGSPSGDQVNFTASLTKNNLTWVQWDGQSALPMTGDERTFGGKVWVSLVDYNVWSPPVGWREKVASGYPAWLQPTGAHDAYALGAEVTHNGQNWRSTTPANVWEPGVFGWTAF